MNYLFLCKLELHNFQRLLVDDNSSCVISLREYTKYNHTIGIDYLLNLVKQTFPLVDITLIELSSMKNL